MIRGIWARCVLLVLTPLLSLPVTLVALFVPRYSDRAMVLAKLWAWAMLAAVGARTSYHGLERATGQQPCVYIANHRSMVDIWALVLALPTSTRFVAKRELFRIPVFGWFLTALGFVPVDRAKHAAAVRSLEVAAQRIRGGRSLVLFPEGSRSPDGSLRPFKKGAFHLALRAGVPVVAVAIRGSFEVLPPGSLRARPGPVELYFEPPIDVTPYLPDDHDGLRSAVHASIARRLRGDVQEADPGTVRFETP